jgi:lipopolysaccharide/colanic/teichoic acid biosynthesis glycosyltransferase
MKESIHTISFFSVTRNAASPVIVFQASPTAARMRREEPTAFYHFGKRTIDIVGAVIGLVLLLPVFAVLAAFVALDSPGGILHRRRVLAQQEHTNERELHTFEAFKFRTMIPNADTFLEQNPRLFAEYRKEFKLADDPRVTRLGSVLRRLSLDELPQLWNVLTGQMSLVGPRMITAPELVHYGSHAACLLRVKPGLTGLWQVSGRTNVSYCQRVQLDMHYIENRSLRLDLEILCRTVGCVLSRRGAV